MIKRLLAEGRNRNLLAILKANYKTVGHYLAYLGQLRSNLIISGGVPRRVLIYVTFLVFPYLPEEFVWASTFLDTGG